MPDMGKQRDAAEDLEELVPALKEIIAQLRRGVPDGLAYALVYRFRREIGYIVSTLGYSNPVSPYDAEAAAIIDLERHSL